jgi:glycosyltransferase involved in cell wall biosynthesis
MSVVGQADDVNIEIIIGDDLSEDSTPSILEDIAAQYPETIRYYRNVTRLGPVGNYLSLTEKARGQFLAHLDGDDLWLPGKLVSQLRFLDQYPDCPAVYTNAFTILDDGSSLGLFNNPQKERFGIADLVVRGNFLCHSSVLYRETLKQGILALPAPFIDYRIHLYCARHGDVGYLNEALVKYRVNSASSILVHMNDSVRELYWEALLDVPRTMVSDRALAGRISVFGRSVFFSAFKKRDVSLLRRSFSEIMKECPTGRMRMTMLIIAAIIRVGFQESVQLLRSVFNPNYLRVLYRR